MDELEQQAEKIFYSRNKCKKCSNLVDNECRLDCYEGRGVDDCINGIWRYLEEKEKENGR